jgi:hypothetical protein
MPHVPAPVIEKLVANRNKMKLPKSILDYFLVALSLLSFWYVYFSVDRNAIGLRGSIFSKADEPLLFWFGALFVIGVGVYLLYLAFKEGGE